jgi:hypothetical protein
MGESADALRSRRQRVCRWLLSLHRLQIAAFGKGLPGGLARALSPSAYQGILLDLYLAALEDRAIYQSSLATTEPPATVHWQAARLERLGAVSRSVDTNDHRRLNLVLTPELQSAYDDFIDAVEAAICRHFPD